MIVKNTSVLRTGFAQALLLGASFLSCAQAGAATEKYVLGELGGHLYMYGSPGDTIKIVPDAQGATGSFEAPYSSGVIYTYSPWLSLKTVEFAVDGNLSFTPALISGNEVQQEFTSSNSSFSMILSDPGRPAADLLRGSITGGRITGQLGSVSNIQITLTVENLSSDLVALATTTTTLTWNNGYLGTPLSTTCFEVDGQCASSASYLESLSLYSLIWSVPGSALASAVPEPGTVAMLGCGLALLAFARKRA